MKRKISFLFLFVTLILVISSFFVEAHASDVSVSYSVHQSTVGWKNYVKDGELAGSINESKAIEAIKIKIEGASNGGVSYKTHISNLGWEKEFKSDDKESGTVGKNTAFEAIQIKLTDDLAKEYDIYYKIYSQNIGWLGWAKNGESAGTVGYGYRAEAIQIKLAKRSESFVEYADEKAFIDGTKQSSLGIQKYISDILLVGLDSNKKIDDARNMLKQKGYYMVEKSFDSYSTKNQNIVYIGYKTTTSYSDAIQDLHLYVPNDKNALPEDVLDYDNRIFELCPVLGDGGFTKSKGNINNGSNDKNPIYLYYTKQSSISPQDYNMSALSEITINNYAYFSLDGIDITQYKNNKNALNSCYIHITKAPYQNIEMVKVKNPTYIKDIKLVGKSDGNPCKDLLRKEGYEVIEYDLNKNTGGDYIYLGYKTTTDYKEAIKDIVVLDGNKYMVDTVKINNRTYNICPYDGDSHFKGIKGDLNSNAGGADLHLFYTKEEDKYKMALRNIRVNNTKNGAVSDMDLNKRAGGDDIFLHVNKINNEGNTMISEVDPNSWMEFIDDDVKLTDITIPGAHDAGTAHTSAVFPFSKFTSCQEYHIGTQVWYNKQILKSNKNVIEEGLLEHGVRYFDIRYGLKESTLDRTKDGDIKFASDHLKLVHGGYTCQAKSEETEINTNAYKILSNDILMGWIKSFLDKNKTETVILDLSTDDGSNNALAERYAYEFFMKQAIENNPNYPQIYIGNKIPTLGECRGKIVVLSDFNTNNYWYNQNPLKIVMSGLNYDRTPFDGDAHFKEVLGDLNSNTKGSKISLYYTKDEIDSKALTAISFNNKKDGSLNALDLNKGAGGDQIYLHFEKNVNNSNATFIKDLKLFGGANVESIKSKLTSEGYTLIDNNLNEKAGGDYIYLGYKTTTVYNEAIKGITLLDGIGSNANYLIEKEGKKVNFAFQNAGSGSYGDETNKTFGCVLENKERGYSIYKDNKYDKISWANWEEKWIWVKNGLDSAQKFSDMAKENGFDAFMLNYASANNIAKVDPFGSPLGYAESINPQIVAYIQETYKKDAKERFFGIIAMDYVDHAGGATNISSVIYSSNFYRNIKTKNDSKQEQFDYIEDDDEEYKIESEDLKYENNNKKVSIKSNGPVSKFSDIFIDGNPLAEDEYEIEDYNNQIDEEPEMVIHIKDDYMNKLDEGDHTISIKYSDGKTSNNLTLSKAKSPNLVLAITISILSSIIIGAGLLVIINRKRNY